MFTCDSAEQSAVEHPCWSLLNDASQETKFLSIRGILNGTTNYILTEMSQNRMTFQEALTNAQKLGYAEREPSMDIDGFDTACKVVILANWIMNKKITLKDVDRTGIREVSLQALDEASKRGNTIKLIGSIEGEKATVKPTEIPKNNPLCVSGVLERNNLLY
jgi:homoserine dehydrogenase